MTRGHHHGWVPRCRPVPACQVGTYMSGVVSLASTSTVRIPARPSSRGISTTRS